jgi:hypothetical protein
VISLLSGKLEPAPETWTGSALDPALTQLFERLHLSQQATNTFRNLFTLFHEPIAFELEQLDTLAPVEQDLGRLTHGLEALEPMPKLLTLLDELLIVIP